jgi:hypothetical protein
MNTCGCVIWQCWWRSYIQAILFLWGEWQLGEEIDKELEIF